MAAKVPYYHITPCCEQATPSGDFRIPGATLVANGVYVYNGISFQDPATGMWFYSGFCYTIQYIDSDFTLYPNAFNFADISPAAGNACSSSDCAACTIAPIPEAYEVYHCCDAANITYVNIDTTACTIVGSVWIYGGPGFITSTGFQFNTGACYSVTHIANGVYVPGPDCADFTTLAYDTCQEAEDASFCPACQSGQRYLAFTSCCTDITILFKGGGVAMSYYGVREYLGPLVDGLENSCYSINVGTVGDLVVPDIPAYNLLPDPPVYIEGVTFSTLSSIYTNCDLFTNECPDCTVQCYTLYTCDGQSFNTTIDLSVYLNTWIDITEASGFATGPWFVTENNGPCNDAINTFTVKGADADPCDPICYDIQGKGKITYVSYDFTINDYVLITALSPLKICSYIYPQADLSVLITAFGTCIDNGETLECPLLCFILTNCADGTITYNSNSQSLINYIGQVVTINGYDGCWKVELNEADCDCPINATVLTSYVDCVDCLPIIAYKLINCTNPAQVQYTYQDLSAYVGHGVELDCGQCWVVEQIDYAPPSVQVITIAFDFENCVACGRTYYKLEDCAGIEPDAYTYTDLSEYVDLVIKLKDCPTCWKVTETRELLSPASIISLEQKYEDCITCQMDVPCLCSTIRNDQAFSASFDYVDCFGEKLTTAIILPGETSDKICLQRWLKGVEKTNYVKYYGDCTQAGARLSPWACPPPVYHLRTVKPGYNTPACSAEKYERISCKAAQILYRNVLTLRYGISNCCPEEDQNWLIKKELIDLAALYNPAYPCAPNNPCGCGCGSQGSCGSSCGCGQPDDCSCNQPRSCNS